MHPAPYPICYPASPAFASEPSRRRLSAGFVSRCVNRIRAQVAKNKGPHNGKTTPSNLTPPCSNRAAFHCGQCETTLLLEAEEGFRDDAIDATRALRRLQSTMKTHGNIQPRRGRRGIREQRDHLSDF